MTSLNVFTLVRIHLVYSLVVSLSRNTGFYLAGLLVSSCRTGGVLEPGIFTYCLMVMKD